MKISALSNAEIFFLNVTRSVTHHTPKAYITRRSRTSRLRKQAHHTPQGVHHSAKPNITRQSRKPQWSGG